MKKKTTAGKRSFVLFTFLRFYDSITPRNAGTEDSQFQYNTLSGFTDRTDYDFTHENEFEDDVTRYYLKSKPKLYCIEKK